MKNRKHGPYIQFEHIETEMKKRIIAKINYYIGNMDETSYSGNKGTIVHFHKLKIRLLENQALTKKMHQNLCWIKKEILAEK